jgi:glutathione peroxidase
MPNESIYDFEAKDIDGSLKKLSEYKGNALLVVNTASKCGFTPQYEGLEKLYKNYNNKGFQILGFPCNQFGGQEPGDENEIKNFCSLSYQVTFPMFAKIEVNGNNAHPLYKYLKKNSKGFLGTEFIKWNFTKFLIGKNGEVLKRYSPTDTPEDISKDLEELLS